MRYTFGRWLAFTVVTLFSAAFVWVALRALVFGETLLDALRLFVKLVVIP